MMVTAVFEPLVHPAKIDAVDAPITATSDNDNAVLNFLFIYHSSVSISHLIIFRGISDERFAVAHNRFA